MLDVRCFRLRGHPARIRTMDSSETDVPAYGPKLDTSVPDLSSPIPTEAGLSSESRDRILNSANWFFWIAALSIINTVIAHSGSNWQFFLGLGVTAVADAVALQVGGIGVGVALVFDVLAASAFVAIGLLARRMLMWPFVLGMVAFALDGVLLVLLEDYFSVAFHGYALFSIFLGVRELRQVRTDRGTVA